MTEVVGQRNRVSRCAHCLACVLGFASLLSLPSAFADHVGPTLILPAAGHLGEAPLWFEVNERADEVFVSEGAASTRIEVIQGSTNVVVDRLELGFEARFARVAASGMTNRVYVAHPAEAKVLVFQRPLNLLNEVDLGQLPGRLLADSVRGLVYVGHEASLSVIDEIANNVRTVPVGGSPVAIQAESGHLYVERPGEVVLVDPANGVVVDTIALAGVPRSSLAVNPATNKVYTSQMIGDNGPFDGKIWIVNGDTGAVQSITVQGDPLPIAVNSAAGRVYVADHSFADRIWVLSADEDSIVDEIDLNAPPPWNLNGRCFDHHALALSSATGNVYVPCAAFAPTRISMVVSPGANAAP